MFGYKEGAPGNSGAVGVSLHGKRGSFSWLSVPNTICLVGSLLGHTTIPYLRHSSFMSLNLKKIWTQGISVHFPCLLNCNLHPHPQPSVPCPPGDTVATQRRRRILSNFSLEDRTASSYQGCISRVSVRKWIVYFSPER